MHMRIAICCKSRVLDRTALGNVRYTYDFKISDNPLFTLCEASFNGIMVFVLLYYGIK